MISPFQKYRNHFCIAFLIASLSICAFAENGDALTPESVIAALERKWAQVSDCTCTMESLIRLGDKEQYNVSDYYFMRPQWILMKFTAGENTGGGVLYNPEKNEVVGHRGGILSILKIPFSPENSMVRSIRGHRIDDNHMGFEIARWVDYLKNLSPALRFSGDTIILEVQGIDTLEYNGAYSEKLYIDGKIMLLIGHDQFSFDGQLINRMRISDIKINVGLKREDFKL